MNRYIEYYKDFAEQIEQKLVRRYELKGEYG